MKLRNMTDKYKLMMVLYQNEEILNCVKGYINVISERVMEILHNDWYKVAYIRDWDISEETCYIEECSIEEFEDLFDYMDEEMFIPEINYGGLMECYSRYMTMKEENPDDDDLNLNLDCVRNEFADLLEQGFRDYFHRLKSRRFIFEEFCNLLDKAKNDDCELYEEFKVEEFKEYLDIEVDRDFIINNEKMVLMKELEDTMKELERVNSKVQELEQKIASL